MRSWKSTRKRWEIKYRDTGVVSLQEICREPADSIQKGKIVVQNHIKLEKTYTAYGYEYSLWSIDGISLPKYLQSWAADLPDDKRVRVPVPFSDLWPAWVRNLDWEGDVRFVWKAIEMDKAVLPLLLCPDDADFTCIVVVVEAEKTEDFVYWNKVGFVLHDREDFAEEKNSGILKLEAYSDEDWEKYGDNIALEEVNSPAWCQWISENWAEELYRRRMNYTLPFYQTEGNVFWMKETGWVFDRREYESMVEEYWELETLEQVERFDFREKLTVRECANLICGLTRHGREALEEHLRDFQEILLHIFAMENISKPLLCLLKSDPAPERSIQIYCKAIEIMWRYGDEAVVNVVDVTILEDLSDENNLWQKFGSYISEEFRTYINHEVLTYNLMMGGVMPL